jgi:iron complex outermembrane receptor protein
MKKSFPFRYLTLCMAHALAFACNAFAQSNESVTVTITGTRSNQDDLAKQNTSASGFIDTPLLTTPVAVTRFSQALLQDLRIRQTTDAAKFDASVNDAYNAVGYAEQFSIRGFALDNSTSYRKDGITIPGDASIPLENKEAIEIIKGISGFQSGVATPGGVINYITKRPTATPLRSVTVEASERGTLFGTVDLGGQFGETLTDKNADKNLNKRFGYRINAAGERLRSYVKGANGERQFVSAAFDWHLTPEMLLQIDADYQHRSQISVPGFQLSDGVRLPVGINPNINLNDQPWARPVDTRDSDVGARFAWQFTPDWRATVSTNRHQFKRDDFTAFPYGCSAGNFFPGYCANGDYDVYDYQSTSESKILIGSRAVLNGRFNTAGLQHDVAAGIEHSARRDYFGDAVYDFVGTSNIFQPRIVPPSSNRTGPVFLRRNDQESSAFAQDILTVTPEWQLHTGVRYVATNRAQFELNKDRQHFLLPSAALVFNPTPEQSLYASFTQGLEHGGVAPFGTSNQNQLLTPGRSTQYEIGYKAALHHDVNFSIAAFQINKPLELTNAANVFTQQGEAVHRGIELSAQARVSPEFNLQASVTALNAKQRDTGDATLDDKRVTNVPEFKSTVYADYAPQQLAGLHLNATWQYASSKAFSPDNAVTVPGYHVMNLGARYGTQIAGTATTLRLNVDNVFDRFYWRDVTQSLGGYLLPGAPRIYKISAQFDF